MTPDRNQGRYAVLGVLPRGVGHVSGSCPLRRVVAVCSVAVALVGPFAAPGVQIARAAKVHVTRVSAAPAYVSRLVAPKRVTVRYRLSRSARVTVTVKNSSGLVKRLKYNSLQKAGTRTVYWDLKKSSGSWASNGTYTISVYAKRSGHAGAPYPAKVKTTIDNTAPSGYPTAVSPTSIAPAMGQKTTITYRLSDNVTTAKLRATIEIVNSAGSVVRSMSQVNVAQGLGRTCVWDGRTSSATPVPSGPYWARLRVQDLAGNQSVSTNSLISRLSVNAGAPTASSTRRRTTT